MSRPKLLDAFCGAGGASMGYDLAGFEVTGVDMKPQPRYPFRFILGDALEYISTHGHEYAAISASPPCQAYSSTRHLPNVRRDHPDLIAPTRAVLEDCGRPWVMENVPGAPLNPPAIMLCGLFFGLRVFRHRWFESSVLLLAPGHIPHGSRRVGEDGFVTVAGNGGGHSVGWWERRRVVPPDHRNKAAWSRAMGIDWMTRDELSQAIPPAYTRWIGCQLIRYCTFAVPHSLS